MTPSRLMIMGSISGAIAVLGGIAFPDRALEIFAFAGGMVFGKGYGVWEERTR